MVSSASLAWMFTLAAACTTASTPFSARATDFSSAMSPCT